MLNNQNSTIETEIEKLTSNQENESINTSSEKALTNKKLLSDLQAHFALTSTISDIYSENKNIKEDLADQIIEVMDRCRISSMRLAKVLNIEQQVIIDILKSKICQGYLQLISRDELCKKFHIDRKIILKILVDSGFVILETWQLAQLRKHFDNGIYELWRPINPLLDSYFKGTILGDGHLHRSEKAFPKITPSLIQLEEALNILNPLQNDILNEKDLSNRIATFNDAIAIFSASKTAYLMLHKARLEKDWLCYISKLLCNNGYPCSLSERPMVYKDSIPKLDKHGNPRFSVLLMSAYSFQLHKLLEDWYPQGKKSVPKDLKLTPTMLLFWYVDDGSYSKWRIRLCTEGFSLEDVQFLAQLLETTLKIHVHIYSHTFKEYPNKLYYRIQISDQKNIQRFFNYLEKAHGPFLEKAEKVFPWKFDRYLKKKDFLNK